jgi:hypothetical protein
MRKVQVAHIGDVKLDRYAQPIGFAPRLIDLGG